MMKRVGWIVSLLMLEALGSVARGQASRDSTGAPTGAAATAHIAGRVVDASDGHSPVRRAIVTIAGSSLAAGRSAITDDEGRFAFERVAAGSFTLTATRPAFVKTTFGATRPSRPGTPLTVRAGDDVRDLTLTMTHGSAIDGMVRDIVGDPAPGMRVEAIRVKHTGTGDHGESAGVALSDDRGEYRIFDLPAGDYVIVATATIIVGIGDIGAPSEGEVDELLASLSRRSGAAAPLPAGGAAHAPQAAKTYSTPATFYPGVIQSAEATRITLGPNDDREGMDFTLRLSHAAAIDGTVLPARAGTVPQIQISIHGAGPDLPVFGGSVGGPSVSMRSADHSFHISNVPPGRYRITARTLGGPGNSTNVISSGGALPRQDDSADVQWAVADVNVAGDDLSGVTLALQPALHVTGRLVFDATALRPPADPSMVKLALEAVADPENGLSGLSGSIPATIRGDGTFEFPAVVPGTYRVTTSIAGGWWLRSAVLDSHDILDGGLKVGESSVAGAVLTLSDRHTAITGTLSGTGGAAAPDYFMVAFSTDRAMWRVPSRRVRSTRPKTDGVFELHDLPPGSYYLAALVDVDATDLEDPAFLESLVSSAVTVTLGEGEQKTQNLRLGGG